jgi:hypothetical protein
MKTTEPRLDDQEFPAPSKPPIDSPATGEAPPGEPPQAEIDPNEAAELSAKFYYWVLSRL